MPVCADCKRSLRGFNPHVYFRPAGAAHNICVCRNCWDRRPESKTSKEIECDA